MDPVSVSVVAALVAGASAAGEEVATKATSDAYDRLKQLIRERFRGAQSYVNAIEENPSSEAEQQMLAAHLSESGASTDADLKETAKQLLSAVEELGTDAEGGAIFDFDRLRAAKNFTLDDIRASGTVLRARHAVFEGDFVAKGIYQGPPNEATEKK